MPGPFSLTIQPRKQKALGTRLGNCFIPKMEFHLNQQKKRGLRPVSKRRATHVPNALETIDNEAFQLIIDYLNAFGT
jgi:hypothetical protein